jgi:hypothetical protein
MKAAWNHDDIVRLMERLEKYQSQLVLHMLLYLNMKAEASEENQSQRLDALENKIVKVLTVSEDKLNLIQSQNASLHRHLNETGVRQTMQQDKTLAAILTLQNGKTSFLSQKGTSFPVIDKGNQKFMTLRSEENKTSAMIKDFKPIQEEVLTCLYFRLLGDRYDTVQAAHGKTYAWIFNGRETSNEDYPVLQMNLVEWLATGSGCYWINRKAGSGKSTLMKYILQHPKSKEALTSWASAAERDLVVASFFLWHLGSPLQKTQEGLLRSLLYDILSARPYLISVVMPELWMAGANRDLGETLSSPSHSELLRWFRRLLDRATSQLRLVFFIDGLDEYEGNHFEIVNLIAAYSENQNVKFLVSSRPIPICIDSFSRFPNIRLQDLTKEDIRQYAEDHLREKIQDRYGDQWDPIITQVVEKSCGVFLWVVLVVRSLLIGLQNFDYVEELHQRLDILPSDLKDLYAHMLRIMPDSYRKQASQLLQISLLASEVQQGQFRMTPLQLYFSEKDDEAALATPIKSLSIQEKNLRCHEIEGRVRSRCCGLLEVRCVEFRLQRNFSSTVVKYQCVDFIHRTVVEFLRIHEVWEGMLSLTADTPFHPSIGLFRSCLLLCKTQPIQSTIALEESSVWHYMDHGMEYASLAQGTHRPVPSSMLSDLDQVVSYHWTSASKCTFGSQAIETHCHWTHGFGLLANSGTQILSGAIGSAARPLCFHTLTVYHCLDSYIKDQPPSTDIGPGLANSEATALLFNAVKYTLQQKPWPLAVQEAMITRCASICCQLLDQGADPNAKFGISATTAWHLMLDFAVKNAQNTEDFQRRFHGTSFIRIYSQLLLSFAKSDAFMNVAVPWTKRQKQGKQVVLEYSALKVLDILFSPQQADKEGFAISKERNLSLAAFHKQLVDTMIRKGAVIREWENGQLVSGPPESVTDEPMTLTIPAPGRRRSRSADSETKKGKRAGLKNLGNFWLALSRPSSQGFKE